MTGFEIVKAYFILTRPVNVLIAFLSILLAGYLCGIGNTWAILILACSTGALITAGANAINDYFDLDIDRINKPFRPLPSGRVHPRGVWVFAWSLFGLAVLLADAIGPLAVAITFASSLLLFWYSAKLKRTVLWGNLTVSFVTGLAFVYGGVAVGQIKPALIPAAFAFFMHWGREIIKDMEDVAGDQAYGARTLPVVYGLRPAQYLVTVLFLLLAIGTTLPYLYKIYGIFYLWVVVFGVDTVLLATVFFIWRSPTTTMLRRLSAILKADMLAGLVAIYLGRW
jgi:geranylgeranylglycerol-phosphate geranylgeranyltransferase